MELLQQRQSGLTRFTLNRPARRNAFTRTMVADLHAGISAAVSDPESRCIVIEGAGDHFCAGRDLRDFAGELPIEEIRAADDQWADIFHLLHQADTPSVAVVRGYAFAGGFTLAMGCDFVLAADNALFQVSEMRHGFPAAINTPVLSKLLGPRWALELAVLGDTVPADRLYAMGLINRLTEADKLAQLADTFTQQLLTRDPIAIGETKRLNRAVMEGGLDIGLDMGSLINSQVALTGTFAKAAESLKK